MKTLEDQVNSILDEATLMSFSTSNAGAPYTVWLHCAREGKWNLVVQTKPNSTHSKHLVSNDKVSGALLPSQKSDQGVRGLYFTGNARRSVDETELETLVNAYAKRFGHDDSNLSDALSGKDDKYTFYLVEPSQFILFDNYINPESPRQVLDV